MSNPLVDQGTLNRLRASVIWPDFPELNVTSPFLNREGIRLSLDGDAVTFLPSMTGAVTSPEPYQMITLAINLLKTQSLAAQYKAQQEGDARLGGCTVRPDANTLPPYQLTNCAIQSVRELNFSGSEAGYSVTIRGYYIINNDLWSLA